MDCRYKIGVIVVTYNRLEKLKIALNSYASQTYLPEFICVFNNCSTDSTGDFLKNWALQDDGYKKYVINSDKNLGGSGGFNGAFDYCKTLDFDFLWISDDDAYPERKALEKINCYAYTNYDRVGAICGTVIENGEINYSHRRTYKKYIFGIKELNSNANDYTKENFEIKLFSFVGVAIKKEVIANCGLPNKDYFIWYDDTEYSLKVSKKYSIVCIPDIKIIHDVSSANDELSWKSYYGFRNRLHMIKSNFSRLTYFFAKTRYNLTIIKDWFLFRERAKVKIDAKKDAERGCLGISDKYKPGSKV